MQQAAPPSGRGLPFEVDDSIDSRRSRFATPSRPWWRPASTWGRALLAFGLLIVVCAFAYAFHECKSFFEHDPHFRIAGTSNIEAVGLAEVNRGDILPVFGEDIGRNIFFIPLAERRKQLEQIPWVQQATVMRLLPDQIRVSVVERQPVAFVRHGQQIGLVDAHGVLLNMPPALMSQHHYSFPVLTGIDGGDPLPSRKARVDLYTRLITELDAGGQHLSDQVSEIDLTDPEDARVLMPEQGSDVLAHFGEDHFLERYQRYKAHIAEWRQQYPKLAAVDLRYDQQVVLEMNQGSTTTSAPTTLSADGGGPAATKPVDSPGSTAAAKPDPGKPVANAEAPASHPAKKQTVAHAAGADRLKRKAAAMKAAAARAKEKKRAQTKVSAQKQSKQKTSANPHAAAAVTGQ